MGNFAELYCKQHNLPVQDFGKEVLRQSLPLRIRIVAPIITLFWPEYFLPERDFVSDVGNMRQPGDFKWALADFRSDPANRKFVRHQLRVRGSVSQMRKVIATVPAFAKNHSTKELIGDSDASSVD